MSTPELFNTTSKWGKLWLHESERVYSDRLVTPADLEAYNKAALALGKKYFNITEVDDYYKKKVRAMDGQHRVTVLHRLPLCPPPENAQCCK